MSYLSNEKCKGKMQACIVFWEEIALDTYMGENDPGIKY